MCDYDPGQGWLDTKQLQRRRAKYIKLFCKTRNNVMKKLGSDMHIPFKYCDFQCMSDDSFEPARFASSGEDPLAGFLSLIFERTRAIPLPDPESALGLRPRVFESLHAYECALLGQSTA